MQLETIMFMQVTRMFYDLAIEDLTILFGKASEQGNKETVVFQTGLTGSTGFVSSFDHVSPVILSIMKEPQINANPVQQICVYLRSSAVNILNDEEAKYRLKKNDLLVCEGGDIGRTAIWNQEVENCYYQNHLHRLRAKKSDIDPFFILQWLEYSFVYGKVYFGKANVTTIPNLSKSRLAELIIPHPPLPEQHKIAHVLSTVQKAIEQQDNLIRTTTELKKALMQKLFTEGTRGEPQKKTEIGLVPESWDVLKMGECLLQTQYGISVKGNDAGEVPILRMTNQKDGYISGDNLQYVNISEKELNKFKVNIGDVIFNRTNSFELVGRTSIFNLVGDYVFASYLIRLITNSEKLYPEFLNLYLNADETQNRLKSIATRGVSQSNISATRLSSFIIPLPSLAEQKEIISTIIAFNLKIEYQNKKKQTLTALFKTLLHELMTGQRRVHEVEFKVR